MRRQLQQLIKADDISINLDDLGELDAAVREILQGVADESRNLIIGQIGIDDATLFGQVETRAAKWAAEHSADLVTMITDATRDKLQTAIATAVAQALPKDEMIDSIMAASMDDPNGSFSEERAQFIADTEIGFANSQGSLMGMQEAEKAGVNLQKEWDATDEPCPICQENQDAGPIALDAQFPSGDDCPLAHPRCRCVLVGVTSD